MAVISFDATSVNTVYIKDPLPAGDYTVTIVDSDIFITPQGDTCLELGYEVVNHPHTGYKLYDRFIIASKRSNSVDPARLATVCDSVGVSKLTDSTQLHGKQHTIRVIRRMTGYGDVVNDIEGYVNAKVNKGGSMRIKFSFEAGDEYHVNIHKYPEGFSYEDVEDAVSSYLESPDASDDAREIIETVLNSFDIGWHYERYRIICI